MSPQRLVLAAVLVLSAALFIGLLPLAARAWRTYSGVAQRRQQDATDRAPKPSDDTSERIRTLESLGFHQIGVTSVVMPLGEQYARIMAADDAESYAIVVDYSGRGTGLTALYTAWADGMWIGTLHPAGDRYERSNLELSVVSGTLAEAAEAHRSRVEGMRPTHGLPHPIERIADVLALDADYRRRFGGRELRPLIIRTTLLPMSALLLTAAISAYAFLTAP